MEKFPENNETETPEKKENKLENLEERLEACATFKDLDEVLKDTVPTANLEKVLNSIKRVRDGKESIYTLSSRADLRYQVHRLLWTDSSQDKSELLDTPYVEGEKPWAICVQWINGNGAAGYTSAQYGLGMKKAAYLEDQAERSVQRKYWADTVREYPEIDKGGLSGGAILPVKDENGKEWEVVYGTYQGSGGRPGISRMRPAK